MRCDWRFLPCLLALSLAAPALANQAPDEPLLAGSEDVPVPKRVEFVQPIYPPEAAARGLRGIVILSLVVGEDGRVEDVEIVRSVPPFDEPAIAAVQRWRYEPTQVEGRPVRVRITVPISFLMKLPEVTRQEGIPELRSGALPPFPSETDQVETVSAELSLAPDGHVAGAQVLEGNSPWSEALIGAVRTWRFDDNDLGADVQMSFRVEARFLPAGDGEERRVSLQLTGLRRSESRPTAPVTPSVAEAIPAEPEALAPASPPDESAAEHGTEGEQAQAPGEAPSAPPADRPQAGAPGAGAPREAEEPAAPEGSEAQAPRGQPATASPSGAAGEEPSSEAVESEGSSQTSAPAVSPGEPAAGPADPTDTDPATEVLGGGPDPGASTEPELPDEPGVSSVRGVLLEPGVPDLSQGRRPGVPPFARMQGVEGDVRVRFAVDAAGQSFVSAVEGPEELRLAARATVESWLFSRQTAERLYLIADLSYDESTATAVVKRER